MFLIDMILLGDLVVHNRSLVALSDYVETSGIYRIFRHHENSQIASAD